MANKKHKIHLRDISNLDLKRHTNNATFELEFIGRNQNDDPKIIVLHFERWWVEYIARELWNVIDGEEACIEQQKCAMHRED